VSPISQQLMICLVAAHVLGDFVLQSDHDAANKRRLRTLLKHALLISALSYGLAGVWQNWAIPVLVFLSHAIVDGLTARLGSQGVRRFLVDQTAHFAAILLIAVLCSRNVTSLFLVSWGGLPLLKTLIVGSGLVLAVKAGRILIRLAVQPYLAALEETAKADEGKLVAETRGFPDGGSMIGCLERTIIFLFVLTGHPTGIGFLIAAKSILRFGELSEKRHRMEAEYIIIGTLMSFGYGMFVAFVTKYLLGVDWR